MYFPLFLFLFPFPVLFRTVYSVCPSIPKCSCSRSQSKSKPRSSVEEYKLKCLKIENVDDISFANVTQFTDISSLDLSNNSITTIYYNSFPLPKLAKLYLERNSIYHIEKGGFSGLSNLRVLVLSNNKIKTVSKEMFEGLVSLETLKLDQNIITTVPENTFTKLLSLNKLGLTGNPLVCDCQLYWLRVSNIKLIQNPVCASPPDVQGEPIEKLDKDDFCPSHKKFEPIIIMRPHESQIVFEGDSLRLSCVIEHSELSRQNSDDVQLRWFLEGQSPLELFNQSVYLEEYSGSSGEHFGSILRIPRLMVQHKGVWECNFSSEDVNKSSNVEIHVISQESKFCKATVTRNDRGFYSWPETLAGNTVRLPCEIADSDSAGSLASYFCSEDGQWTDLNTKQCSYVSAVTRILQQFSKVNVTSHKPSLMESATRLLNFTLDNAENIEEMMDLVHLVHAVENYLPFLSQVQELTDPLTKIISFLMKFPTSVFSEAQTRFDTSTQLLKIIETIVTYTSSFEYQSNEFAVKGLEIYQDTFSGITCTWMKHADMSADTKFILNCSTSNKTTFSKNMNIEASIQVPSNLFYQPDLEMVHLSLRHLMIAVFTEPKLFPEKNASSKYVVSSPVISAYLIGSKSEKLDEPIYVILKSNHGLNPHLSWWDVDTNTWIKEGCQNLQTFSSTTSMLIFQCYRTGYFALLTEKRKSPVRQTYSKYTSLVMSKFEMLDPLVYIGTFALVPCLLILASIYIVVYSSIQMNRRIKHSKINSWVSTAFFSLTYCLGIWQVDNGAICQVIGLIVYYFALSTLFWMAVTVKSLYKCVQKNKRSMSTPSEDIPNSEMILHKPILGIYLVGWGISSILCGISGAVNLQGYAGETYCFLTPGPSLSTVLIPASLVLFYLLMMCLLLSCVTSNSDSNAQLSVGTQAIDLELLDAGRVSLTHESSVRSVATPSSQIEDSQHSPSDQLKTYTIYLTLYLFLIISSACCVMMPEANKQIYGAVYLIASLSICVVEFGTFYVRRADVRNACCKLRQGIFDENQFTQPPPDVHLKPPSVEDISSKSDFPKANANLFKLPQQQQYCKGNVNPESFYNPHQSIVAKKFFRKQRRRRNNIVIRKCRSGGSSPVSMCLFDRNFKTNNTEVDMERSKFLPEQENLEIPPSSAPEYDEVANTQSSDYSKVYTRQAKCDKDWNCYDTVSDINSEPTYNYAFIDKVKNDYSSRSVLTDHSSSNSHLYATVAPDIVNPPIAKCRNSQYVGSYRNITYPLTQAKNNYTFNTGPTKPTAEFRARRTRLQPGALDCKNTEGKVETCV